MEPRLQPVLHPRADGSAGRGRRGEPEPRAAQHLLAARAVHAADDRRRVGRACRSISSGSSARRRSWRRSLMFGVMIGALFGVTALRNSAWGVPALFGFTFIAGVMLAPILSVAAGFRNGGQLVALAGGMTAAMFFAMAAIATVTKRDFAFLGKFLFVGPDRADRRVARQPVLPGAGGVADDLGRRRADLLAVPAARRQQDRPRRRDELHHRDAQPVPRRLQHLHQPAATCCSRSRVSATDTRRICRPARGEAISPRFCVARQRAAAVSFNRTRPSTRRAPCAGTC